MTRSKNLQLSLTIDDVEDSVIFYTSKILKQIKSNSPADS